ncbi:MAG: ATP-binding protein [Candidatus Omnitrophica bacterium]|nr:ATP-binding protein [Candidatus Omnitrophota bacterium]
MIQIDCDYNFYGRTETLQTLKRRYLDLKDGYRQNVAIVGNRYAGKSSILYQFIKNLDEDNIAYIYLDIENKDFNYFCHKFIRSLLYSFSKNKQLPPHDDIKLLMQSAQGYIPHTIDVIKRIFRDFHLGKQNDAYLGLINLPEVFTNESQQFCMLIIDEFQYIEELMGAMAFQELGKKIMVQKRCLYILSSSYQNQANKILSEKLSLLFGNFEIISLEPFNGRESQNFIQSNLKELKIGSQLKSFLTDFTGGYPLYINLICQELINLTAIHQQGEIYLPILTQAVENTIFNRWGVISRHFEIMMNELCSGKANCYMPAILMELAKGTSKIQDISRTLDIKKKYVNQRINHLLSAGIIIRNGHFLYFKDKLFKYWIKFIYQRRLTSEDFMPEKQRRQFKDEFNAAVEHFKNCSRKEFSSRIMEILDCFDNDSIDLEGRKYKMPHFRQFLPCAFNNELGKNIEGIKALTDEHEWLIVVKKENFMESDVNFILSETKKGKKKPARCLIVSLSQLDDQTRLKALQERFWIWNERELTTLFNLFDKPSVI